MVAALAITSAVSAQQSECTFTTSEESVTRTFDGIVRIVSVDGGDAINVVNRRTGEVIETIDFGGESVGVRCGLAGRENNAPRPSAPAVNTPTVSDTPTAPVRSTVRRSFRRVSQTTTSAPIPSAPARTSTSTGGGFPASAALGLPN